MFKHSVRLVLLVAAVVMLLGVFTPSAAQSRNVADLRWTTFIEAGVAEPNVFIMGSYGLLWRITPDAALSVLQQPVYATTGELRLDPLDFWGDAQATHVGPYAVGATLGITADDWLNASGAGVVTVDDGMVSVNVSYTGLIPDGLYTLWCMHSPPSLDVEPVIESCGVPDDAESGFYADDGGGLDIDVSFSAVLQDNEESTSVLVLVWHSDGQVYGNNPGPLGYKTFIHLHAPVPVSVR